MPPIDQPRDDGVGVKNWIFIKYLGKLIDCPLKPDLIRVRGTFLAYLYCALCAAIRLPKKNSLKGQAMNIAMFITIKINMFSSVI